MFFLNNTTRTIPLEQIGLYVGENENPDNQKQVLSVEVELPSMKHLVPLAFVDTPGLGSAYVHNTEAAFKWLPNTGAALVAVSSDAPLSERDLELLEELRRHTPKIILLLTKADLLTESQRAEVMQFVRQQLSRKQKDAVPVYFYSIQPGLGMILKKNLEQQCLSPLIQHREEVVGTIAQHKFLSLTAQTLNYLRIALAAATQTEQSRNDLRQKLTQERQEFKAFREELLLLGNEWSARALDVYLERLRADRQSIQIKVDAALRKQFPSWRLRLPPFVQAYGLWLREFIEPKLCEVSQSKKTMFLEPLDKTRQHLLRALRAFQDRIRDHVQQALGVALYYHEFRLEVQEPEEPPMHVSTDFMIRSKSLAILCQCVSFGDWWNVIYSVALITRWRKICLDWHPTGEIALL